jgi:hypothetical protein
MRSAACVLLLALVAPAAQAYYANRAEVAAATEAAASEAKAYSQSALIVAALQQALLQSTVEPLHAEARMQQLLLQLRDAPASAAARALVLDLLDHSPRTFTDAVDPEQRRRTVPAFEIAGGARAVLRGWDDRSAQARYRDALAQADFATLRAADNPRVLAELIGAADSAELSLLQQADLPQTAARFALFERSADADIARTLLRDAPEATTQQLASTVAQRLPAATALALLGDAQVHERRRSAARLAIGTLVADHAPARAYLLSTLGDAHGASSAAALARNLDGVTLAALAAMLAAGNDDAGTRHALLALRLSDDPRATAQLRAYADDPAQPAALRDEVRAWLD